MHADFCWLTLDDVLETHRRQIELFGGGQGVRDLGLVESAVASPTNLWLYENEADVVILAVKLGMAIAGNHGFVDGNKRTGISCMLQFIEANGYIVSVPNDDMLGRAFETALLDGNTASFIDLIGDFIRETP